MQEIWSPQRKFSTWRRLWLALAESEKELGLDITDEQIAFSIAQMKKFGIVDSGDTEKMGIGAMTDDDIEEDPSTEEPAPGAAPGAAPPPGGSESVTVKTSRRKHGPRLVGALVGVEAFGDRMLGAQPVWRLATPGHWHTLDARSAQVLAPRDAAQAQQIAAAIAAANQRQEVDVLIVCRGGGSIEDLWAFNEEPVARAIATSALPVVSGVGHETDFTIADFVADRRAPTPTAAAEMVSPSREAMQQSLDLTRRHLARALGRLLTDKSQRLDYLARRLQHPGEKLRRQQASLQQLQARQGSRPRALQQLDKCSWSVDADPAQPLQLQADDRRRFAHVFDPAVGARADEHLVHKDVVQWLAGGQAHVGQGALDRTALAGVLFLVGVGHTGINAQHHFR